MLEGHTGCTSRRAHALKQELTQRLRAVRPIYHCQGAPSGRSNSDGGMFGRSLNRLFASGAAQHLRGGTRLAGTLCDMRGTMHSDYFATCPKGTAELLAAELTEFGGNSLHARVGRVAFRGELQVAYRACLWSRVANRVLLIVARFPAAEEVALYVGVGAIDWSAHLGID